MPVPNATKVRAGTAKRRFDGYPYALNVPAVLVLAVVIGVPLAQVAWMSLTKYDFFTEPSFVGFENFIHLFTEDRTFWRVVQNTVVWTVVSLTLEFGFALVAALVLSKIVKLSPLLRALALLPWVVPPVTAGLIWKTLLDADSGAINEVLNTVGIGAQPFLASPDQAIWALIVVAVWRYSPFMIIALLAGIQSIDRDLYEASSLDGARPFQQFRYITWPLLRPVVLVVLAMGTIWRVGHFDLVQMLTGGGPAGSTELLATAAYRTTIDELDGGSGAAIAMVTLFVTILVGLPIFRRLTRERGVR